MDKAIKTAVDRAIRKVADDMKQKMVADYWRHVEEFELRQAKRIVDAHLKRISQ